MADESKIKRAITQWLALQSDTFFWTVFTTGIPNGEGKFRKNPSKGVADICGVKKGKAWAFEVKSAIGRLTPEQKQFLSDFASAGGYACVVRSLDDAIQAYSEI